MTKVKTDARGLYVRTDGGIFRPHRSKWAAGHLDTIDDGQTAFKDGDKVHARHHGGTVISTIADESRTTTERWTSHGSYFDGQGRPRSTNLAWAPSS